MKQNGNNDRQGDGDSVQYKWNNLDDIRHSIRNEFETTWEIMNEANEGKRPKPYASIGVFGDILQKKGKKKEEERVLCFTLGTWREKKPPLQIFHNELRLMSKNYPWHKESILRHAAENDGIFYGKADKTENGSDIVNGGLEQKYEVTRIFPTERYIGSLKSWLPTKEFKNEEIKDAYDHLLIIGEDLTKLGVWREPCAVCGIFAIGTKDDKENDEIEPKVLQNYIDLLYFLRTAAIMLTTYCFWEATSDPLGKLAEAARIQITEDLLNKIKSEGKTLNQDDMDQLFQLVWDLGEGFSKRRALRTLFANEKGSKEYFYNDILGDSGTVEHMKNIAVCHDINKLPWDPEKIVNALINYKAKNSERPFWILGDILGQPKVSLSRKIIPTLDLIEKKLSNKNISPMESYHLWQVGLSIILIHAKEIREKREDYLNKIFDFMDLCLKNMGTNILYHAMAKELGSRVYNVLETGNSGLEHSVEGHCMRIVGPDSFQALSSFRNKFEFINKRKIENKCQITFLVSQKGGVGKSFVAANICAALSLKNREKRNNICLVETDFAGPTYVYLQDVSKQYWEWRSSEDGRRRSDIYTNFLVEPEYPPSPPFFIKWNGSNIDIFPAFPELSAQVLSASEEVIASPRSFSYDLDRFVSTIEREYKYKHILIDTPAELRWMTLASAYLASRRNSNVLLVAKVDRHTYACLPELASIFVARGIRTAIIFNGVRKLDQVFFQNEHSKAFVDYLATHPHNDDLTIYPNTKITTLVENLTELNPNLKHNVRVKRFLVPWYHDLGGFESFEKMIKVKPKISDDPWIKLANWIRQPQQGDKYVK